IISIEREINPRNPQHAFKRCEVYGSLTHTTTDHYGIEWFKKGKALQAKKAEALKSTRAKSSNANRSKTPTKSGCSRHMIGVNNYLHKYVEQLWCLEMILHAQLKVMALSNVMFDEKRGTIFNSNKEIVMIALRVYFLKKKSQAPETIMSFIKRVENQNDIKVKQLRTDNGTKFKNSILINFCDEKGISQNFSSPYTSEQNTVAERKNRTLIEAARTMLLGYVFFKQYSTEAIATTCYTQNRSTIVKRHLKTPYEIFSNDGYLLGYSLVSKAFRFFNTKRQQTKETYHITFYESPDAIKFLKPLVDNINIAKNERYPLDEYLHPYDPSQRNKVWTLVPAPYGKTITGSKWGFRNKRDETGIVIKNKARLMAQGYNHQGGIDYDETFAPVTILEAIRIFHAFAIYINFIVYQMDVKSAFLNVKTPMVPHNNLRPDISSKAVNETQYRGFNLKGYSDSNYASCNMDGKSTSSACQLLGGKLVCWSAKKQQSVAMSSAEAEYVAAAECCANILWMKSQLTDYDIVYENVSIFCDNTSAIVISNNLVLPSRTKHIDIRYHFIWDHILKGDIELHFILAQYQLADIFTNPMDETTFKRLIVELDFHVKCQFSFCKQPLACLSKKKSKLIWEDLIPKLNKKTREKIVPYPRFISLLIEHMMPEYDNEELTINPTQAICKLDVPMVFKALKPSSQTEEVPQGKRPEAKSRLKRKKSSKHTSESKIVASKSKTSQSKIETKSSSAKDKSPSHPSPPTLVVGEIDKEAQQAAGSLTSLGATSKEGSHPQLSSGTNEESRADDILEKIKLEDLSEFLKDTRSAFFTHDSPQHNPIIVTDESEEEEDDKDDTHATSYNVPEDTLSQKDDLEQQKAKAEAEVTSLKARPSYLDLNQLTELLVTSLKYELSKLLASHDFASCLPTELKELHTKVTELSGENKELKKHVRDMEIELPGDLLEIPTKLETFTSTISSLTSWVAKLKNIQWELPTKFQALLVLVSSDQKKIKTLDSLPILLNKFTKTLNSFATVVENTSGAITKDVPLAGQANTSPIDGGKCNTPKMGHSGI
nr:retrovirus-related Pol polyprotein from transposon TNT 1-94 [Tanacetum cinerariifolium]